MRIICSVNLSGILERKIEMDNPISVLREILHWSLRQNESPYGGLPNHLQDLVENVLDESNVPGELSKADIDGIRSDLAACEENGLEYVTMPVRRVKALFSVFEWVQHEREGE
jgi:hypothetical protein